MTSRSRTNRADSGYGQPRRQANACLRCYEKKVKCDMDSRCQPCTSCAREGIECKKRSRKPYPPRKDSIRRASAPAAYPVPARLPISSSKRSASLPSQLLPTSICHPDPFAFSDPFLDVTNPLPGSIANVSTIDPPITLCDGGLAMDALSFPSDNQLTFDDLLDQCHNMKQSPPNPHYLMPQAPTALRNPQPQGLPYAEAKGCFTVPAPLVCEDLMRCYFHHVHPIMPIVDIAEVLEQYTEGSFQHTRLLLLWSMFFVAANFVTDATLSLSGHSSRQELKKSAYDRAKCLHDIGFEQDRMTLIQSALLLSFWYADFQDSEEPRHWTNLAISTAQTIGLHRDPSYRVVGDTASDSQRRLWANLWWSCYLRDRWLSFSSGRPPQISDDNFDVPMVTGDCMLESMEQKQGAWSAYVPEDLSRLNSTWLGLLKVTVVLGKILVAKTPMDATYVKRLELQIAECLPEKQPHPAHQGSLQFFESFARLHVEATIIALYRPFASILRSEHGYVTDSALSDTADGKVKAAATRTAGILDNIVSTDTLKFAGPMMVPLLVPAMSIHLLQTRSPDYFTSAWSKNRLELSLLVLRRLEDNYPGASLVYTSFSQNSENNLLSSAMFSHDSASSLWSTADSAVHASSWSVSPVNAGGSMRTSVPASTTSWSATSGSDFDPGWDLWDFPSILSPSDKLFLPLEDGDKSLGTGVETTWGSNGGSVTQPFEML